LHAGAGPTWFEALPQTESAGSDFILVHRMVDGQQQLVGAVLVRMSLSALMGDYVDLGIAQSARIHILTDEGKQLASVPERQAADTEDPSNADALRTRMSFAHHPLQIEISEPVDAVMRSWREQEISSAWRTSVLVLLAASLLIALSAALKRRDRLEQERQRLERGLRETQRTDAVGFLAASMAHDFNNVLGAMVGYAEIARAQVGESVPAARTLDSLLTASERARRLVRRVLTFDPHRSVAKESLDIRPIALEVLDQLSPGLPGGIELSIGPQHPIALIDGDATEVHQVIMNLCTNAIRAMPAGGRLYLGIENLIVHETKVLVIGELHPGRWVCLEVSDTGIGISSTQLSTIFDSFYTTRGPEEIGGIGLTVVRNIVRAMQGALDIESERGRGTNVRVYWPALDCTTHVPEARCTSEQGQGQSVLVVDDEPELVRVAEEIVASLGYEAVGFRDSSAALESFRAEPARFDAVITDERMPVMRGTALARAIHEVRPDVPVLLVTGFRDSHVDQRAREAGIDIILDKPLRAKHLHAALSRALPH
ncbi:MAG: ATP-binding protein, partial [Povalibacter sp.]